MSARPMAHPWLVVAAQFRFDRVSSRQLPEAAARVMKLGISSPALEGLSRLGPKSTDEARTLFFDSLRELAIEPPNDIDALEIVAQSIAEDIVAGHVSPRDGASEITDAWERADCPSLPWIAPFASADIDWDCLPGTPAELSEGILEAARDLLEG